MVIDLIGSFGWLGDEIGFVFIMVLWTCITIYLSWNVNTQNLEFETENQHKQNVTLKIRKTQRNITSNHKLEK